MLVLHNVPLDFDITSPKDLKRYNEAMKTLMHNASVLKELTNGENSVENYVITLEHECALLVEFIDNMLGEGTCRRFLKDKISINSLNDLCADIANAINVQAEETKKKFAPYKPNKRRAKKT